MYYVKQPQLQQQRSLEKQMSKLISGKEALIALANGEEVEFKDGTNKWENIKYHMNLDLSMFLTAPDWMNFRLKPRTITINRIEVPAPFEPKEGEAYWYITDCEHGYGAAKNRAGYRVGIAAWRTEEEIKQVVAALRGVFKIAKD